MHLQSSQLGTALNSMRKSADLTCTNAMQPHFSTVLGWVKALNQDHLLWYAISVHINMVSACSILSLSKSAVSCSGFKVLLLLLLLLPGWIPVTGLTCPSKRSRGWYSLLNTC